MSAQTSPAGPEPTARADPAAIRAELPEELRGQFDAEYQAALEEARASYQLDRLNEVIQAWWQLCGRDAARGTSRQSRPAGGCCGATRSRPSRLTWTRSGRKAACTRSSTAAGPEPKPNASGPPANRRCRRDRAARPRPLGGPSAPELPAEFRTLAFGDWGLVVYLIRERQATVVLLDLIWAGLFQE